jgi:colanic acid/amylovoran biosynthesis protein
MNILITNIHSLHNAGDAALLWATIQQLRSNFPGCRIMLAINLPGTFQPYVQALQDFSPAEPGVEDLEVVGSFMHWARKNDSQGAPTWNVPAIFQLGLHSLGLAVRARFSPGRQLTASARRSAGRQRLFQAYDQADIVVSVPGNFLYHSGRFGLPLLINLFSMAFASWINKPVYIFPQSIGPLKRRWEIWLTKQVLSKTRIIMVREEESLRFLQQAGFSHPRLVQVPDVAMDFQGFSAEVGWNWLRKYYPPEDETRPRLGLTAINWWVQTQDFSFEQQSRYEEALVEACQYFIHEVGGEVYIFTQVTGDYEIARDELPAGRIYERLAEQTHAVHLIDQGVLPHLLQAAYSQMDIFIGTRMHSNIFALSGDVPVIAVAYRYKTIGLMKAMGLAEWVLGINQLGEEGGKSLLLERVQSLWRQADDLRPLIRQQVETLAEQSRQAGRLVAEDYFQQVKNHPAETAE